MKRPDNTIPVEDAPPNPASGDESATGLPLLRTWPAVYLFVLGSFILWVVLLFALSRFYA